MIAGRYSLDREIGRGGMGAVWLGRDEVLDRLVAIKQVGRQPGGTSPDLLRAEREARVAASVNHPHVVAIFDLVEEDDEQWLVMEYLDCRNLAELIRDEGPMGPDRAAGILAQAAEALSAAHAAGVIHRDVKPSNILVTADGQAKLSDFGIARAEADAALTQTGLVTGSPAYLAPEIASGQVVTPASDVWSLGATLFHALSGRPPYDVGDNVLGALYRIVHDPPPRLENAGWLTPLLESSLTHDPTARWSMADVATFLGSGSAAPVPAAAGPRHAVPPSPPAAGEPVERTEVLTTTPTALASAPSPAPPAPPDDRAAPRRRRGVLPWLVGAGVVALGVMIGLILFFDSQDSPEPPAADSTNQPTGNASQPPSVDKGDLEAFAEQYVETAASDPSAGFALLTPEYQDESGGLEGYEQFWGSVTNPHILSVEADASDPDRLTVSYTYRYNRRGQGVRTEPVTLLLVQVADGFRIAGTA